MLTDFNCKGPQKKHIHHQTKEDLTLLYICVCTYLSESGYKVVDSVYEAKKTLKN